MELKSKEEIKVMTLDEKRLYLDELKQYKAQLEASKGLREQGAGLKRASETMMKYNPTGAFDLMDKAAQTDIKREQLMKNKGMSPEDIRRQLRMNADRESQMALNVGLTKDEQAVYRKRANIYLLESMKDEPSLQQAAIDVGALITGDGGVNQGGTKALVRADIKALGKIKYKGKDSEAALLAIHQKINDAKDLTGTEKDELRTEADQAAPKNVAPSTARPSKSNVETVKLLNTALADVITYSMGSKLDPNNEADRLLLAKMKSRSYANESYMSDDAVLSTGVIGQLFANMSSTRTLPLADAQRYKKELNDLYTKAVNKAKIYLTDKYKTQISNAAYDNAENILSENKFTGDANLGGGLRTLSKPNAKDYKTSQEYNNAMKLYRAQGGK